MSADTTNNFFAMRPGLPGADSWHPHDLILLTPNSPAPRQLAVRAFASPQVRQILFTAAFIVRKREVGVKRAHTREAAFLRAFFKGDHVRLNK
ncbi:hypothetical protein [Micromonospora ureilytica]|uniref:hypothetical protein n=1 Tax=Micromonospora ureilytica TaxID=709868 RepID=UPI002E147A16|nr:hypothetical protein OHB55_09665 [Micromonospora ureilytica]